VTDHTLTRTIETAIRHGTADQPAIAACLATADLSARQTGLRRRRLSHLPPA
jgi:hypothetical protein